MNYNSDHALAKKTAEIIRENFPEREITNLLVIRWSGQAWKSKLGHITPLKNPEFGSLIEINSLLNDPYVPEFVVEATLLHELIHYFDGFGSNHERKRRHPHLGGIMKKEFAEFGWTELHKKQKGWLEKNFSKLYYEHERRQKMQNATTLKK
ncbi:MAG: hypothetical protein V1777_03170 [Candidatus Micrarchaeota archaeon]